jgi:uncharacterized membrane protein YeaQ/YmgE (transglycosylase-associated protein family)
MWGGMAGLIVQLISGAIGGNVAGVVFRRYDLGIIGNSIAGIIGGGVVAQIAGALLGSSGIIVGPDGFDFDALVAQITSAGIGGCIVLVTAGLINGATGGERSA